jgi:hypothetical protein
MHWYHPIRISLKRGSAITTKDLDGILRLLRENANMGEIALELRKRNLPFSASGWDELFSKRIVPAVKKGTLARPELIEWLRDAEEYGRQHVFLYECSKVAAAQVVNENVVKRELDRLGRPDLLTNPRIMETPAEPTIVDVRFEQGLYGRALVVKVVETRVHEKLVDEREATEGKRIIREYEIVSTRAVNVARVHEDGFAELRVYSHRNKTDYTAERNELWSRCNVLVPKKHFNEVSIGKAKRNLWQNRRALGKLLRYSSSFLRDASGTVLTAASGSAQQSLFDVAKAEKSLDAFWDDDATCDRSNVWWIKGDPEPSRDIHVMLSGSVNELAVTTHCNRGDYDYVLDQLRRANK